MPHKLPPTPGTAAHAVLQAVANLPPGQYLTSRQVSEMTGVPYKSVCAYLSAMASAELIVRVPVSYGSVEKK